MVHIYKCLAHTFINYGSENSAFLFKAVNIYTTKTDNASTILIELDNINIYLTLLTQLFYLDIWFITASGKVQELPCKSELQPRFSHNSSSSIG